MEVKCVVKDVLKSKKYGLYEGSESYVLLRLLGGKLAYSGMVSISLVILGFITAGLLKDYNTPIALLAGIGMVILGTSLGKWMSRKELHYDFLNNPIPVSEMLTKGDVVTLTINVKR